MTWERSKTGGIVWGIEDDEALGECDPASEGESELALIQTVQAVQS